MTSAQEYDAVDSGGAWLFFAGTVLGLAGIMRVIDGIWALNHSGSSASFPALKDGLLGDKLNTYGWVWLLVGIVLILSSFLVLSRSQLARWVGIVAAAIGGISAIFWMPYYPIWSLLYIGMAVLVFYALLAHGGRETV